MFFHVFSLSFANEPTIVQCCRKHFQTTQRKILCVFTMRPPTGRTNLRRLRELLGFQQDEFSNVTDVSKSYLQQLEHGRRFTNEILERIATRTGISPEWLRRNDRSRPIDSKGKPYTNRQFDLAQARLRDFRPFWRGRGSADIAVCKLLLQRYAEARDLFHRREMHKHFVQFLLDFQLLWARYELHAKYPEHHTGRDAIAEQERREHPDNLFRGVIRDAENCLKAAKR